MKVPFTLFILSEFSNIQQFDTKFINIDYITIKNFFKNNIYSLQNINKNIADKVLYHSPLVILFKNISSALSCLSFNFFKYSFILLSFSGFFISKSKN